MYKYDNTCTIFYSKTSFKIIKYVLNGQKTIIIELYSCELNAVDFTKNQITNHLQFNYSRIKTLIHSLTRIESMYTRVHIDTSFFY